MVYSILLAPSAERQLTTLAGPIQKRIVKRLRTLAANPRSQGVKNSPAKMTYTEFEKATTGSSIRSVTKN